MSADAERWPRLKLPRHPVLDWVETKYRPEELLAMATAVSKSQHPIPAVGGGVWDTAIETVLRALAASPQALKALNPSRRLPPVDGVVSLNRAVHARVLAELSPTEKTWFIWRQVAEVWGVSEGQVKDDVGNHRASDPGPKDAVRSIKYRPDDAERVTLAIVHNVCRASGRDRADVLNDFDADLRDRARQYLAAKATK